ncbi:MAG: BMP family ABC transporter substrate-binding protein [Oscillospiraceae bacterium]|jgi:basic membrane protein A|nr:BMP family ABC transporter substrate-binding protein [Oscillospiraceae bacterium]
MKKNLLTYALIVLSIVFLSSCSIKESSKSENTVLRIAMVTDGGGISDQGFNQSIWEGLKELENQNKAKVSYLESKSNADFSNNFDKLAEKNDIVIGVGFTIEDSIVSAAEQNKNTEFIAVDITPKKKVENLCSIDLNAHEASFLTGYIASKMTKTGKIGFVGGIKSFPIDQLKCGFEAGILLGQKELNKNINLQVQYAGSFSDTSKCKAVAQSMISSGCDIIFHAAGGGGLGIFEAVKESNNNNSNEVKNFAIGVDKDQSIYAPEYTLTSAIKNLGEAVKHVCDYYIKNGKFEKNEFKMGLKEECVGLPKKNKNIPENVMKEVESIINKIISSEINPPDNEASLKDFEKKLQNK